MELISDILNLSLAKEDHEETVQKRWDYIQEQLEKDPNWVGYDHAEYWSGNTELLLHLNDYLIGTNGKLYKKNKKGEIEVFENNTSNYHEKWAYTEPGVRKIFQVHRVLASTFIPKKSFHRDKEYKELDVNHKDTRPWNNNIINLEWSTRSENVQHAYENGVVKCNAKNKNTDIVMGTVQIPGPYKNLQFAFPSTHHLVKCGFIKGNILKQIHGNSKLIYGCTWEKLTVIPDDIPTTPPAGYLDFLLNNPHLSDSRVKPIVGTIITGKNSGVKFSLYGTNEIKSLGMILSNIREGIKKKIVRYGCVWDYISLEDSIKLPRGVLLGKEYITSR